AVEILKTHPDGPLVERSCNGVLKARCVVFLAEPRGRIAVLFEDRADRGVVRTDDRVVTWVTGGLFGHNTEAHGGMAAASDQCVARGRAERSRMKLSVAQSHVRDTVKRRCRYDTAESTGYAITGVVGHDQQYIGRTLGRHHFRRPVWLRLRSIEADLPPELRWGRRQIVSIDWGGGVGRAGGARGLLRHRRSEGKCGKDQSGERHCD